MQLNTEDRPFEMVPEQSLLRGASPTTRALGWGYPANSLLFDAKIGRFRSRFQETGPGTGAFGLNWPSRTGKFKLSSQDYPV